MIWRLALVAVLCVAGCGVPHRTVKPDGTEKIDGKPDKSTKPKEVMATDCLREFGVALADVFLECAKLADDPDHDQTDIAQQMGAKQKAGRVKAFLPLMAELGEAEDNAEMAVLLRKWAAELNPPASQEDSDDE